MNVHTRKRDDDKRVSSERNVEGVASTAIAGRASAGGTDRDSRWALDSGSSWDANWDRCLFTSYSSYEDGSQPKITLADNSAVLVKGIGTVKIPAMKGNQRYNLTLKNVRHVPAMGGNLLAIGKLFKMGYNASCRDDRIRVYKKGLYTLVEDIWDSSTGLYFCMCKHKSSARCHFSQPSRIDCRSRPSIPNYPKGRD